MNTGSRTPTSLSNKQQPSAPKQDRNSTFRFPDSNSPELEKKSSFDNEWDHELSRRAVTETNENEDESDFVMNTEGEEY